MLNDDYRRRAALARKGGPEAYARAAARFLGNTSEGGRGATSRPGPNTVGARAGNESQPVCGSEQAGPPPGPPGGPANGCGPASGPGKDGVGAADPDTLAEMLAADPELLVRAMRARPSENGFGVDVVALARDVARGRFVV